MIWMMLFMAFPVVGLALFYLFPWQTALPYYVLGCAISVLLNWVMMRAMKLPVRTGIEGLIGKHANVIEWEGQVGRVRCGGESWTAMADRHLNLHPGDRVRIMRVEGVTLEIEPAT
jgi:membrane-bound serine protease (ClpP class)